MGSVSLSLSVSSEEGNGDSRRSYSMSADVSELGSSIGDFAEDEGEAGGGGGGGFCSASFSSIAAGSSTPLTPTFSFPLIGGKDVVLWDEKPHKPSSDSSGLCSQFSSFMPFLSLHYTEIKSIM